MARGKNADLTDNEVATRLESYGDNKDVTDELYGFGTMMLNDSVARIGKMDTKAAALAAYSGALIAVLAATRDLWTKMQHAQVVLIEPLVVALARRECARNLQFHSRITY